MKKNILIFLLVLLLPQQLTAAGIFVNPNKLFLKTTAKQQVIKELKVKNISPGPVIYNLYTDELSEMIAINPPFFRLEPNAEQIITLTIVPSVSGVLTTNISIVAQEIDRRKFNADAGVKIPIEIIALPVGTNSNYTIIIIFCLFLIVVLSGLIFILKKRMSLWNKIFTSRSINFLGHKWWFK